MPTAVSIDRRSILCGAVALIGDAVPALSAEGSDLLPLYDGVHPFLRWARFCCDNSWAGGQASTDLLSIRDWRSATARVDDAVDQAPYRLGRTFPGVLPKPGEAVNCVGAAIRKMGLLIINHGFPPGNARLMYLVRAGPGQKDHAALLLRFREGDFVLDSVAPETRPGLHHWSRLARRPVLISEGKESYRAVNTWRSWRPQRWES